MGVIMDCRTLEIPFFFPLHDDLPLLNFFAVVKIRYFGEVIFWLLGMRKV